VSQMQSALFHSVCAVQPVGCSVEVRGVVELSSSSGRRHRQLSQSAVEVVVSRQLDTSSDAVMVGPPSVLTASVDIATALGVTRSSISITVSASVTEVAVQLVSTGSVNSVQAQEMLSVQSAIPAVLASEMGLNVSQIRFAATPTLIAPPHPPPPAPPAMPTPLLAPGLSDSPNSPLWGVVGGLLALLLVLLTAGGLVVCTRRRRRHTRSSLVVLPRRASSAATHALPIKLAQVASSTASAWQDSADVTRIQLPLSPKTPRAPPYSLSYMDDPKSKSHPGRHSCRASNSDPAPDDTARSQDTTASRRTWFNLAPTVRDAAALNGAPLRAVDESGVPTPTAAPLPEPQTRVHEAVPDHSMGSNFHA